MKKNVVLGLIAPIALATSVFAMVEAQAQPVQKGGAYGAPQQRGPGAQVRPVGGPPGYYRGGPRGYRGPGPGYYRPGYGPGPRYYGRGPGYYYGGPPPVAYPYDNGAAAALGILGGLAVGGAIAGGAPYYEECRIVPRRVWVPGWGYRIREVRICD